MDGFLENESVDVTESSHGPDSCEQITLDVRVAAQHAFFLWLQNKMLL